MSLLNVQSTVRISLFVLNFTYKFFINHTYFLGWPLLKRLLRACDGQYVRNDARKTSLPLTIYAHNDSNKSDGADMNSEHLSSTLQISTAVKSCRKAILSWTFAGHVSQGIRERLKNYAMSTLMVEDVTLCGMSLVNAFADTKSAQFPKDRLRADLLHAASTAGAGENGVRMHIVMPNKKNGMRSLVVSPCSSVCCIQCQVHCNTKTCNIFFPPLRVWIIGPFCETWWNGTTANSKTRDI